jgi:hypothetical protein
MVVGSSLIKVQCLSFIDSEGANYKLVEEHLIVGFDVRIIMKYKIAYQDIEREHLLPWITQEGMPTMIV